MYIVINTKKYELKFGFGALRMLCEYYGYNKVSALGDLVKKFGLDSETGLEEPTFEQLDFIGQIVISGVKNLNKDVEITENDVMDALLPNPEKFGKIFELFTSSVSKNSSNSAEKGN